MVSCCLPSTLTWRTSATCRSETSICVEPCAEVMACVMPAPAAPPMSAQASASAAIFSPSRFFVGFFSSQGSAFAAVFGTSV